MGLRHSAATLPLLLVAALVGCANLPGPAPGAPAASERATAGDFEFSGRISLRQGEASYAANISWQHDATRDEILLSTPLGQGLAELSRDAAGARLRTADGKRFEAPDWEGLAAQAFGAQLPLAKLPRWIVADTPAGASRDAAGRPLAFSEDDWSVAYLSYESEAANARPQLVELKRADIALRLRIDAWQGSR